MCTRSSSTTRACHWRRAGFGGIAFRKDPSGHHWINTACEGEGASIWWPNKDQWRDEPEGMTLSVAIPNDLVDVSNGRFVGKTDLGDGYTRWDWLIHYPINSYNVSLNIGNYVHFTDRLGDLTLDYFVLPGSLEKAKMQFAQAKPMIETYEKVFGEYPFEKDGYKLLHDLFQHFKYQNIMTEDVVRFFNAQLGQNLTPIFDQYLRRPEIPTLELAFHEGEGTMAYRWKAEERDFAMPIRAGSRGNWQIIEPTTAWKTLRTSLQRDEFEVATDLYYVNVTKQ